MSENNKTIRISKLQEGHRGPSAAAPKIAMTREPLSVVPSTPRAKAHSGSSTAAPVIPMTAGPQSIVPMSSPSEKK
jgi:hypothetical protein